MDNTSIPEAARCTVKEDFVVILTQTRYASQLVRLSAVEKEDKWR